jgi:hypothetical protein
LAKEEHSLAEEMHPKVASIEGDISDGASAASANKA